MRSCTEDKQQGVEAEEEQLHLQVCFGFHNVTFSLLWNAKTSAKVTLFKVFLLSSGIECEGGAESSELVRIGKVTSSVRMSGNTCWPLRWSHRCAT